MISEAESDFGYRFLMRAVLVAAAVLGLVCVAIIPPWQSPDEPTHFEYARVLANEGTPWAPRPDPALQKAIILSMDRHDYWRYVGVERPSPLPATFREAPFLEMAPYQIGKNPPLYYLMASLVLRLFPARSLEAELYQLRLLSLIFTLLTVVLVGRCAVEIFGRSSPLVPAAAGCAAFLPQFLVIGTSVSPDPCINLIGAALIYLVLKSVRTKITLTRAILILLVLVLGFLVNYKTFILLAALPGIAVIHGLFNRIRVLSPGRLAVGVGLMLLSLLAGYLVLDRCFPEIARVFAFRINIFFSIIISFLRGQTVFPPGYWSWFNAGLFKSFWLYYGWLQFQLPPAAYLVMKIATLISLGGIVAFLIRWHRKRSVPRGWGGEAIIILLFLAGLSLSSYYLYWGLKVYPTTTQGRHFFLVMPSWAILFTLGWASLFPARRAGLISRGLLIGFFLLALGSILFSILPTFSQNGRSGPGTTGDFLGLPVAGRKPGGVTACLGDDLGWAA